jgi:hypothetical protein
VTDERLERADQRGAGGSKLGAMGEAQTAQESLAARCNLQGCLTAIFRAGSPIDEAPSRGAPHEIDGAVVLDLESPRDDAHRRPLVGAQRLQNQQELMLLRFDAGRAGRGVAEG